MNHKIFVYMKSSANLFLLVFDDTCKQKHKKPIVYQFGKFKGSVFFFNQSKTNNLLIFKIKLSNTSKGHNKGRRLL